MAITVGEIYDNFPTFDPENMIRLKGRKNFDGNKTF